MPGRCLKWLRIVGAALVFLPLLAALLDFRGDIPPGVGKQLASLQFVPAIVMLIVGGGVSVAVIFILLLTLGWGRVYCSTLCPLGILQDIVIWGRNLFGKNSTRYCYQPPQTRLRQTVLWGTILTVVIGFGGLTLALLDPYSNFARIVVDLFRPLAARLNNQLVGLSEARGTHVLYRIEVIFPGVWAFGVAILVFGVVVSLAFWRGRIFCNTICPVGTLLGMISKHAAFQIQINAATCRKCTRCIRACKSQCIDLRTNRVDFSRCVGCYDCLAVCDDAGIGYRFVWAGKPKQKDLPAQPLRSEKVIQPTRRAFLAKSLIGLSASLAVRPSLFAAENLSQTGPVNASGPITPPGSRGVGEFLARCTACHLCLSACPTQVLQPATFTYGWRGFLKPHLDFNVAFCNFECRRCAEVCPAGAIALLDLADKQTTKVGEAAFFRERCIVITNGTDCAACSEHCPTKAVFTKDYGINLRLPEVNAALCIGCGACEHACPVKPDKAIKVTGLLKHAVAQKFIQPKAVAPGSAQDFPF